MAQKYGLFRTASTRNSMINALRLSAKNSKNPSNKKNAGNFRPSSVVMLWA
jgi:hypothetical protein